MKITGMNIAKVVEVVSPLENGLVFCAHCSNRIPNHNKMLITIDKCPNCDKTLKVCEEKTHVIFDKTAGRHGKHFLLKGKFFFFYLSDGLNVLFKSEIISKKAKLY